MIINVLQKRQSPLGKLEFKLPNNINTFKNPPLPSPPKREKETANGLKKCHTLISSTPYCDNRNKISSRSWLESPEGSPIQVHVDQNNGKVFKKNNSLLLEEKESSEGSSVVYVGTERIVEAASPTKNAGKVKTGIPVKSKPMPVKNNRSRSRHCNASPSVHSKENCRKIQTEEESRTVVSPNRSRTRKNKRNETLTDLNGDEEDFAVGSQNKKSCNEQAAISTPGNISRDISVELVKLTGKCHYSFTEV